MALTFATVVSYAAPFSKLRDREGRGEWRHRFRRLYRDAIDSPDERALHKRMMQLRNRFIGHADAQAANIRYPKEPGSSVLEKISPLSDENAEQLRLLSQDLQQLALTRYLDLQPRFAGETDE